MLRPKGPFEAFQLTNEIFYSTFLEKNCFRLPIELSSGARKRLELESFLKKSVISSENGPGPRFSAAAALKASNSLTATMT